MVIVQYICKEKKKTTKKLAELRGRKEKRKRNGEEIFVLLFYAVVYKVAVIVLNINVYVILPLFQMLKKRKGGM
jgi:hypothetical protein